MKRVVIDFVMLKKTFQSAALSNGDAIPFLGEFVFVAAYPDVKSGRGCFVLNGKRVAVVTRVVDGSDMTKVQYNAPKVECDYYIFVAVDSSCEFATLTGYLPAKEWKSPVVNASELKGLK